MNRALLGAWRATVKDQDTIATSTYGRDYRWGSTRSAGRTRLQGGASNGFLSQATLGW